jgi:hypothetical protein
MIVTRMDDLLKYSDIIFPAIFFVTSLIVAKLRRVKLINHDFTLLGFYFLQFGLNTFANFLQDRQINNHIVYHLNSFITQLIFSCYYLEIYKGKKEKKIVIGTIIGYIGFFIFNLIFFQPLNTFNSYSYAFGVFWIVFLSLKTLQLMVDIPESENIYKMKEFWAAAGILFYFGSSFFIFISYNYLSSVSSNNVGILWRIHNIFLAVGCFLFFKAIVSPKWIQR